MDETNAQAARDERATRHGAGLAELGEIAMGLARLVQRQTQLLEQEAAGARTPAEAIKAVEDLARIFERVSRAVRLTYTLEAQLAEGPPAPQPDSDIGPTLLDRWRDEAQESRRQRKAEAGSVLRAIILTEPDIHRRPPLLERLNRRLERESEPADFTYRPVGEMIARICRDLNLSPDWACWNDGWAIDAAVADARHQRFILGEEQSGPRDQLAVSGAAPPPNAGRPGPS